MSAPFLTATACLFAGPAVFLNVIPTATNPGATTAADERKEEALSGAMNERRKTAVAKGSSLTEEAIVDSFRKLSFFLGKLQRYRIHATHSWSRSGNECR
ncbi:hypothetical protein LINPERHAP1_LOCUS16529 [Linum perenne]